MSKYKCLKTFTSSTGRKFWYGGQLPYSDLKLLPYSEQNNFEFIYNEEKQMLGLSEDEGLREHASDLDLETGHD